jgi:hypothetical protein
MKILNNIHNLNKSNETKLMAFKGKYQIITKIVITVSLLSFLESRLIKY